MKVSRSILPLLLVLLTVTAYAATPSSGTITTPSDNTLGTKQTMTYFGGPMLVSTAAGPTVSTRSLDVCFVANAPTACDTFTLNNTLPSDYWSSRSGEVRVKITWTQEPGTPGNDLDLYIINESNQILGSSTGDNLGTGILSEEASVYNPPPGRPLRVVLVNWLSTTPVLRYDATVTFNLVAPPTPPPPTAIIFENHIPPVINGTQLGREALEPTIGVNFTTGNVMYQSGLETLRVSFDDTTVPAKASWTNVAAPITSVETLDPILFTDRDTGRTFVSQLYAACSLLAFTDDDGATWHQNPIGCGLAAAVDHQTVGGGRWAPGMQSVDPVYNYPNSVFYCAQGVAAAACGGSINGGITWNPATPMYTLLDCGGLHGHIKTAPDGTLYVPNNNCGDPPAQGVAVSEDNGLTWSVRTVPGSRGPSGSDPSLYVGRDGTVYFAWSDADDTQENAHLKVAVSRDKGLTWSEPVDVSGPVGINSTVFPAVVAGDDNRAAVAFLGTTTPGDVQSAGFPGVWYLYVAMTFNGGESWTTYNATPNDPVQRGCVWLSGGSNPCRNLLDFMGVTMDEVGRVLVGYADGCIDDPLDATKRCVSNGDFTKAKLATIARQSGGLGLLAAHDGQIFKTVPGAPVLTGLAGDRSAKLNWTTPSNGGSAITGYRVFRGTSSGTGTQIASVGANVNEYTDTGLTNGVTYYYAVKAVNAMGASDPSNEVALTPAYKAAPSAPQRLKAIGKHDGVMLVWSAPQSSGTAQVTNYRIYRGTTPLTKTLLATVGNTTKYNDTSATPGRTYYYQVSAVNSVGESPRSNEASAEPK